MGQWAFHIRPFKGNPARKLLNTAEFEPQLLQEWTFTNIYLPIVIFSPGAVATESVTCTLTIRRNGEVVYQSTQESPKTIKAKQGATAGFGVGFVFAADLLNPFTLTQGQQLTIEATGNGSAKASHEPQVGFEAAPLGEEEIESKEAEGVFRYLSRRLTGHRELS